MISRGMTAVDWIIGLFERKIIVISKSSQLFIFVYPSIAKISLKVYKTMENYCGRPIPPIHDAHDAYLLFFSC
jgi:hypothetical protein